MNTAERAIPVPQVEIAEQRALRRQVLRHGPPLAARAENIKQAVENLAHIDRTPATAALGSGIKGSTSPHSASVKSLA